MSGYSGTPLAKKLGIKPNCKLFLSHAPQNYLNWVAPLPSGVCLAPRLTGDTDIVHLFVTKRETLNKALSSILKVLRDDATVWVSWPKKAAKVPTDVTEDVIRAVALPLGLVDIKVCAVDEVWSGLKLVIRKKNRKV